MGEFAFGADGAAVGNHDVFGDSQPKAGASGLAGAGFIDTIETFEEARQVFGSDAGAEILDIEFDGVGNGARAEHDSSAGSAVLQGIVDEIGKNLMDGFAVGENGRKSVHVGRFLEIKVVDLQVDSVGSAQSRENSLQRRGGVRREERVRLRNEFRRIRRGRE